jgi:hypothetical protein
VLLALSLVFQSLASGNSPNYYPLNGVTTSFQSLDDIVPRVLNSYYVSKTNSFTSTASGSTNWNTSTGALAFDGELIV